jgi:hypothetical protein
MQSGHNKDMRKKKNHKKTGKQPSSRKPSLTFSILVLLIFFGLFFGAVKLLQLSNQNYVLGLRTGVSASTAK